jgi:very-short-patch-repair endonuclease
MTLTDATRVRPTRNPEVKQPRAIYLAGKISKSDWRHAAVLGLRTALHDHDVQDLLPWTERHYYRVFDAFRYTGPFFASCDHGCGHIGSQHGITEACGYGRSEKIAQYILRQCFDAIERCDIFFAWLNPDDRSAFTAHGTLIEIGYAVARNKEIILATPEQPFNDDAFYHGEEEEPIDPSIQDLWFAFQAADRIMLTADPVAALAQLAAEEMEENAPTESPIEDAFWQAHRRLRLAELTGLVTQHQVLDGKYRLDFALPDHKIGIELDGYEYHGTSRGKFVADQQRQRALEAEGWRLIRFAGAEVHVDAESCVRQAAQHVKALKNGGGR